VNTLRGAAVTVIAGLVLGFAAAPAQAITTPVAGAPCGTDDVGRRAPVVSSLTRQPLVTHFLAVNVSAGGGPGGAGGEALYTLPVVGRTTTEISGNSTTQSSWTTAAIQQISATAGYPVRDVPSATTTTDVQVMWRFLNQGYYALYRGVRQPVGTLDALHCVSVTLPDGTSQLQWTARPAGAFSAFAADELGAVRCDEFYPTGSIRAAAQNQLCLTLAAAGNDPAAAAVLANKAARERGRAAASTASDGATTLDLPADFTCDAGYARLVTSDGELAAGITSSSATTVALRSASSGSSTQWRLCQTTGGQYVLQARSTLSWSTPKCLEVTGGFTDGARLGTGDCDGAPAQRFVLHRDPVTGATGVQSVASGSMLAPNDGVLVEGGAVAQYGTGRADGTGTFFLTLTA
jgi:hypothetical protein